MLRYRVGLTLVTIAVWTAACSNSTEPVAAPRGIARQQVAGAPIPVASGVHVTVLPVFDNGKVVPNSLNDLGQIAGDSANFTAFRWSQGRGIQILPIPDTGFFQALGAGIDDIGRVAVSYTPGFLKPTVVAVWETDGTLRIDSSLVPGQNCQASGVNALGVIAGTCDTSVVIWTPTGAPMAVRTSSGQGVSGSVNAISNTGWLVGSESGMGYVLSPSRQLTFLPQQRTSPFPLAVNDFGVAGGEAFDPTILGFGAVVWPNPDSVIALEPGAGGVTNGVADDGNAVGSVVDTVRGTAVPFIWNRTNGLRRLPPLEMDSLGIAKEQGSAVAVNNRRQILGFVLLATTGAKRWVMWSY